VSQAVVYNGAQAKDRSALPQDAESNSGESEHA
jgi:hypothetical protein